MNIDIPSMLGNIPQELGALMIAGAAGAYVRAIFDPQASWGRRFAEGTAGVMGAIFLGGFVGHMIHETVGGGPWAYMASAFILGEGGLVAIHAVRNFILKGPRR